jgi:valyl-tRNA synthetase
MKEMQKRYIPSEVEPKLMKKWQEDKTYKFTFKPDKKTFSIDTPPPTISGRMHIGHAFSYTQGDFIARFQRMSDKNVFFPFGTDDNGIPSEKLVEKINKVKSSKMKRSEFKKLCEVTINNLRPDFILDWKKLGMSCDFELCYSTISEHCQKISQKSFIDLYKDGKEYRKDAPVLWCPTCNTAISQVECEDKDIPSYFNDIIFKVGDEELIIATTRPEYLPACVAIFYHPDDDRYKKYQGKKAKVPLFNHEVPILADKRADPEKGTGIVMCCTFGDQTDMEWYFAHELPLRDLITKEGKLKEIAGKYKDMTTKDARAEIINDLKASELLVNQKPITHTVKIHERCSNEIEIIHSKQWFIKYLDKRDKLLEWGSELNWHPPFMKARYDNWVKGLQWDWLISRQRHNGIPIPVWYCEKCEEVILPEEEDLPLDPLETQPKIKECPKCSHTKFIPEKDVLDTWATSSLSPKLAIELIDDEKIKSELYPMSLRPQAHDIITFWLFNTLVKSRYHDHVNPWKDVTISGHAQDPQGKKMSKSKGNVVDPHKMIEKYSTDALRYWAASSKLGDDLPFQEKDLHTGIKLSTKLWNASKFAFMHLKDYEHKFYELELFDRWLLNHLNLTIKEYNESFEKYQYSKSKAVLDNFFWKIFCDNYLEVCKDRLYNPDKRGEEGRNAALCTLYKTINAVLKMYAPIMPYVTEEIYTSFFSEKEGEKKSIHLTTLPKFDDKTKFKRAREIGDIGINIIEEVRRFKSESNISLKTALKEIRIQAKMTQLDFKDIEDDLIATTKTEKISFTPLTQETEIDLNVDIITMD